MKVLLIVIIALSAALLFSSCNISIDTPSAGVWQSEDGTITLYLGTSYLLPSNRIYNIATLVLSGNEERVAIWFSSREPWFSIRESLKHNELVTGEGILLQGDFQIEGESLYFFIKRGIYADYFSSVVILHRIEDYDPVDPYDWVVPSES